MSEPNPPVSPSAQRPLKQRLGRLWVYFSPYRAAWIAAVLTTLISALTEASVPALLQPLLDQGFTQGTLPLWVVPLAIVLLFAIRGVAHFASQYALAYIANRGMVTLRRQLFDRLLSADLRLFAQQSASQLANTIVYEVQTGSQYLVNAFLNLARDSFTIVALLSYLLYLNWGLTVIVLVLVPVVARILKTMSRRLYSATKLSQVATDELAYVVEENVLAHRIVRLHGAQTQQARRFDALSQDLRRLAIRATRASAATMPLTQLVSAVALAVVIGIALSQGRSGGGSLTVGSFVAFIGAMLMLIAPMRRLADVVHPITRGLAALERGLDLMDQIPAETESPDAAPVPSPVRGEIELQALSVRYRDDTTPALNDIDLHIRPGETVALVGPSGSGKTTLVNVLPRFVQASGGQALLDGVPIERWPLDRLREQFALVSQEVVMLNDSIAANVALGAKADAIDRARVQACLADANLAAYVATLPLGIDTMLGHNATELSGGQRQRLAIARALYKNAPVLLLDEATSALDTESERLVQQAMARAMAGRTTLVIAHRLSTIEHADRIVVMQQGRIVEQGTHAQLGAAGGLYARLQRGGAIETIPQN